MYLDGHRKPIEEYWERYPKALSADEELILLLKVKIFPVPVHLHIELHAVLRLLFHNRAIIEFR